ncbi:hypothetical protein AtNW77_Chr4g0284911 [Arabidopsis thaliana]|uniref:Transmembrane protein n=2 Tax=Arabidopsis thaliana TaxID=3702 RepID=A0A5S9XT31_ARATH|nr:uncharacterized protein AT4G11402 [Arabidopsis thaliana]ANM68157.1 transmembrane protein [Arabidopsis thaliana]CAA0394699.1 unnamed protein product [Arabidopsis thaliana]|eukprot:NP_001329934.1 transmembrane protein [Arabidopsis thaliana]
MEMKTLLKVMFFLFSYLSTFSLAMVPYRGCDVIGVDLGDGSGNYGKGVSKGFLSGRKLVSGPSRSSCGH